MDSTRALMQDPCPFGLPETLTGALTGKGLHIWDFLRNDLSV